MKIQAFVLRGPFTADHMAGFVALLRAIDAADPAKHYEFVALDSDLTGIETAARMLKQAVPPVPGRVTRFGAMPTDPDLWARCLGTVLGHRLGLNGTDMSGDVLREVVTDLFALVAAAGDGS